MYTKKNDKSRAKKGLIVFLLGFFVVLMLAFYEMYYNYSIEQDPSLSNSENIVFEIKKGENINTIAEKLKKQDLIISEFAFKTYLKRNNLDKSIQAGEYILGGDDNIVDLAKKLQKAQEKQKKITILEGWMVDEVANYLSGIGVVSADFYECLATCSFDNKYLGETEKEYKYEGFIFPDTYQISVNSQSEEILNMVFTNFSKKIDLIYQTINAENQTEIEKYAQGHSLFDIITVASMIEREVRTDADRSLVSGIIWNRLKRGMGLGIDATYLYMLGDWKAPITQAVINTDSPYNTRKNIGLPPSPICQPGFKSIEAAFFPTDSDYLYYLTPDTGEVIYGKTLEEHNRNKREYLY